MAPVFQDVIADITEKMGNGMTIFLQDKVDSMAQWDQVCCVHADTSFMWSHQFVCSQDLKWNIYCHVGDQILSYCNSLINWGRIAGHCLLIGVLIEFV